MENLEIGKIHKGEQHRDAVHMAIAPTVAGERLLSGQHVAITGGKAVRSEESIGIVDPFLRVSVKEGETFWLFLYPGSITSLRHEWTHPAFQDNPVAEPAPSPITEADQEMARHVANRLTGRGEKWLREFCENGDCPDYETLMEAIRNGGSHFTTDKYGDSYGVRIDRDCIMVNGSDAHGSIPDEFWDHVEAVTGKKQVNRPTGFSCSC